MTFTHTIFNIDEINALAMRMYLHFHYSICTLTQLIKRANEVYMHGAAVQQIKSGIMRITKTILNALMHVYMCV